MQNLDRFKFRWFEKSTQQMYDVQMLDVKNDYAQVLGHFADEYTPVDEVKIFDGVLMQCTGLKDRNNKLIFEGDIVKVTEEKYSSLNYEINTIEWDKDLARFTLGKTLKGVLRNIAGSDLHTLLFCGYDRDVKLEIIGNIYENEELLKNN